MLFVFEVLFPGQTVCRRVFVNRKGDCRSGPAGWRWDGEWRDKGWSDVGTDEEMERCVQQFKIGRQEIAESQILGGKVQDTVLLCLQAYQIWTSVIASRRVWWVDSQVVPTRTFR